MDRANEPENGSCIVYYQAYPDPSSSPYSIVPFAFIYVVLFILGLAGNSLLIYVTLKNKTLQTVQNIFILNLAGSDVMMCLLSLPITPVANIYKNWYFGAVLCHLIPCIQGVSIFVCTFSLGAIAIDRYILVVRPHARPLSRRGAIITTIILWTISIIVTLPYAFYMGVVDYEDEGICGLFCTEFWPSASSRRAYTMVVMACQFVVPFICMAYCYAKIFGVLSKRAKVKLRKMDERSFAMEQTCVVRSGSTNSLDKKNGEKDNTVNSFFEKQERDRQRLTQQTRRTTSILAAMVVWFGLTWLPHNVLSLIIEYDERLTIFKIFHTGDTDINYLLNLFTHSFSMSNVVVNPILYAWLNPQFRQLVINTCLGTTEKQRAMAQRTVYMNLTSKNEKKKTNGVATKSPIGRSPLVKEIKEKLHQSPVKTIDDEAKKNMMVEFSENDTLV